MTSKLSPEYRIFAEWMRNNRYAPGPSDTISQLLLELDWQHERRMDDLRDAEMELVHAFAMLREARKHIRKLGGTPHYGRVNYTPIRRPFKYRTVSSDRFPTSR